MMETNERFEKLLKANPATLSKVDRVLEGTSGNQEDVDTRLLTFSKAAKSLGVSRQTVWRMCKEGKLRAITIREGSRRVPMEAIKELINTKKEKSNDN